MNMEEKIARAICAQEIEITDSDQTSDWRAHMVSELWPEWVPHARAALSALKEPTVSMIMSAIDEEFKHFGAPKGTCFEHETVALIKKKFVAMIQAAEEGK